MKFATVFVAALAGFAQSAQQPGQPAPVERVTTAVIDAAIQRGARWLGAQQREDGAFAPVDARSACPVAMTAMALWSLNEPEPRSLAAVDADRAARFLIAQRRADGGIYDPARGLAVYTTGVSTRALRTLGTRADWPELGAVRSEGELYTYRAAATESVLDAAKPGEVTAAQSNAVARTLLGDKAKTDEAKRKALEFLARVARDTESLPARVRAPGVVDRRHDVGAFGYDDLLPFVYLDLAPEHQLAQRAREALRNYYTPERNPDLTKRYGPEGFGTGTAGLFYYYFVAARTLATFGVGALVTADGTSHDWADELATRLARAQRPDGSWANADAQWWEGEPLLTTSYALLTLKLCRARIAAGVAK